MKTVMKKNSDTVDAWKREYILINMNKFKCKSIYNLDIILKLNKRIIRGTVYNICGVPIANAAVEISEFDYSYRFRKIVGYTFTDNLGRYVICIEISSFSFYEIDIYSPLSF